MPGLVSAPPPTPVATAPGLACSGPVRLPIHCAVYPSRRPVARPLPDAWSPGPAWPTVRRPSARPPPGPFAIPWFALPAWTPRQGNSPSAPLVAFALPPTVGATGPGPAGSPPTAGIASTVAGPPGVVAAIESRPPVAASHSPIPGATPSGPLRSSPVEQLTQIDAGQSRSHAPRRPPGAWFLPPALPSTAGPAARLRPSPTASR